MYEASPSTTDPRNLVPPIFALPCPTTQVNAVIITFHEKYWWPTVIEDVKKGVIIKDVDAYVLSISIALGHKRMPTT